MLRGSLCFVLILACIPALAGQSSPVPACLAGFCLDAQLPTEHAVRKRYGGKPIDVAYKTRGYCYHFTSASTPVFGMLLFKRRPDQWRLVTIRLADVPLCRTPARVATAVDLGTKEGVELGVSKSAVDGVYGQPQFLLDAQSKTLGYLVGHQAAQVLDGASQYVPDDMTTLGSAIFVFRDGKVAAIEVSVDE